MKVTQRIPRLKPGFSVAAREAIETRRSHELNGCVCEPCRMLVIGPTARTLRLIHKGLCPIVLEFTFAMAQAGIENAGFENVERDLPTEEFPSTHTETVMGSKGPVTFHSDEPLDDALATLGFQIQRASPKQQPSLRPRPN